MWHKEWALLSLDDREQFSRLVNLMLAKNLHSQGPDGSKG